MKLVEVISSNIKAVGYDSGKLYVMFNGGSVYKYENVPVSLYEDIMKAESKGKFVNQNVARSFSYSRVKDQEFEIIKEGAK